MCASGLAPLQCRGRGGRGSPGRRGAVRGAAASARPDGPGAVRGAAAAAGAAEDASHPYPLGAAGTELPGSARDSLPGERADCEVGMRVALSSPSSLPLFPRRCPPVGVDSMLFWARPLLSRRWASTPEPSQVLPRSRRGERTFPEKGGLPAGCPAGGGLRRGLSPSHATLLPHPAVLPRCWEWLEPLLPICHAQVEIV